MPNNPDYKAAYEILEQALHDAVHILRQAQVHTSLKMRIESGDLSTTLEEENE